jgi:hypothetical protein
MMYLISFNNLSTSIETYVMFVKIFAYKNISKFYHKTSRPKHNINLSNINMHMDHMIHIDQMSQM